MISAQEGDANKTGDQALFGPVGMGVLTPLSGPNNFANNFFASQINMDDGTLDTAGTFGTRNQINGTPGTNNVLNVPATDVQVTKAVNSNVAIVGDILTYTFSLSNAGTAAVTSLVLNEQVPPGSEFIAGSVILNGTSLPQASPTAGIPLASLAPGTSAVITLQTRVVSVPSPNLLRDTATVNYIFGTTPLITMSNEVIVTVVEVGLVVTKRADRSFVTLGDLITYTFVFTNTGNYPTDIVFFDNIPVITTFIPNSMKLDDLPFPGITPDTRMYHGTLEPGETRAPIALGSLLPNQSLTLQFRALAEFQPTPAATINQGSFTYSFRFPDGRIVAGTAVTNPVTVTINDNEE